MRLLLLYPDRRPDSIDRIRCFSDVWGYYLGQELAKHVRVDHDVIPSRLADKELANWFGSIDVENYDAVIVLGLRYFSQVPKEISQNFRQRLYPGFLCQIYDGSRLDNDGVDITFTIKDESVNTNYRFGSDANRYVRHRAHNEYIGWAADPNLNVPNQSDTTLQFLIDHTNYGENPVDRSVDIIEQIRKFYHSDIWRDQWRDLVVRRFDSGKIITVDLQDQSPIQKYNRIGIPYQEVCREHGQAHVFFVTHPESVGLVVLETAMAGALTVTPEKFIPQDRLSTVRHVAYKDQINWSKVLESIDPAASRSRAMENTWEQVAKRVRDIINIRRIIRGAQQ
jgi:hypothetical protein